MFNGKGLQNSAEIKEAIYLAVTRRKFPKCKYHIPYCNMEYATDKNQNLAYQ